MSWLARSLANSLKLENNDEQEPVHEQIVESPGRGVKEDLSELTKTFSRQLWGVASFLAPPPSENPNSSSISDPSQNPSTEPSISSRNTSETDSDVEKVAEPIISGSEAQDLPRMAGIRNDFAEIGGKFKTGLSRFSTNKAVSEISKLASSFLPFVSEEENLEENLGDRGGLGEKSSGGAVGVTEEVLAFARNISMHPETWLDFPLFPDDEDADDFDMSDAQQEHALAVEHLAPRLAALRIELCPGHISEGCFWKIYFVLLHSRLNKHDAELLSTPQIVEARSMLLQDLQNRTKPGGRSANPAPLEQFSTPLASNIAADTTSLKTFSLEPRNSLPVTDPETEKHPVVTYETKMIDKSIVEEGSTIQTRSKALPSTSSEQVGPKYEEDEDDWFEEENANMGHGSAGAIPLGNEEDVSFSDLEEEDDSKPVKGSTIKGSRGWVQLSKSSGDAEGSDCPSGSTRLPRNSEIKESNDWLSVDEIDAKHHHH